MMKKNILIPFFVIGCIFFMGSCKSKTSAYREAYEKAQEKDVSYPVINDDVVVYSPPPVVDDDVTVYTPTQSEKVNVVDDDASQLKRYSVVIYSFKNKTNANAAKEEMTKHGYRVILAQNESGMYRVIIASYDDKATAVAKRDEVKSKYAPRFDDIWILERLY